MTKIVTFLLGFSLTFNFLNAQISIENSDLPVPGSSVLVAITNGNVVDLGTASADSQTWDFTALQAIQTKTVEFGAPTDFLGAADFSDAELARTSPLLDVFGVSLGDALPLPIELPEANAFYGTNATGGYDFQGIHTDLYIEGFLDGDYTSVPVDNELSFYPTGTYGENVQSNGALLMLAPLNEQVLELIGPALGDTSGIDIGALLEIAEAGISIGIESDMTIDAFGTMNLPNGISHEVLRFKEDLILNLSVGAYIQIPILGPSEVFNLIDTTITATQYRFWAKDMAYPLATMLALGEEGVISSAEYIFTPAPAVANFDYTVNENNNLILSFENTSSGDFTAVSWDFGDGQSGIGNQPTHLYELPGTYDVILTITDLNGETQTFSQTITVDEAVSVSDIEAQNLAIFPNPTADFLTIEGIATEYTPIFQIFDATGRLVQQGILLDNARLDVRSLIAGIYFVQIHANGKESRRTSFIKK